MERQAYQEPYTDRQCSMQLPEGTQSHLDIFRAFQDRYFDLLTQRRSDNAREAQTQRESILEANQSGREGFWTSLLLAGSFLVLMFFFLLIAIERHQRRRVGAERASLDVNG